MAIPIPQNSKQEVLEVQLKLREIQADVKWVSVEGIHLTLKFMGEVEEERIALIAQKLSEKLCNEKSFTIQMGGIGSFPSLDNPRVIWIGIEKGEKQIVELQKRVEEVLKPLGFSQEERAFHPHLTLGRVRGKKNIALIVNSLKSIRLPEFTPIKVNRVTFFQSILRPQGAEYKIIREFELLC